MACGGFTCSKNALAALNVLYILVAFILIGVAAYGRVVAIITSISIMSGIIACGVFLLVIAFVGLLGAIKHHQVMLFFYMIILFMIFFVQFSIACACIAVNSKQQKSLVHSGWNKADDSLKNKVQQSYDCCGFEEADQGDLNLHPACSVAACCKDVDSVCCGTNSTLVSNSTVTCPCQGCWPKMEDNVDQALKISGGIGLFFSFTEIFGVWITVRYRNQKDPRANPSAFL